MPFTSPGRLAQLLALVLTVLTTLFSLGSAYVALSTKAAITELELRIVREIQANENTDRSRYVTRDEFRKLETEVYRHQEEDRRP